MLRVRVDLSVVVDVPETSVNRDASIDGALLRKKIRDVVILHEDYVIGDYEVVGAIDVGGTV